MTVYCVELGVQQLNNLSRMTHSVIVQGQTMVDALELVEKHCPALLEVADVRQVFAIKHARIHWITGEIEIAQEVYGDALVLSSGVADLPRPRTGGEQ